MISFIIKRIIGSIVVLFAVSFMSFMLIFFAPGDPATIMLAKQIGQRPNQMQLESFRAEHGFDKPLMVQYYNWLKNAVQGDLGNSIRTGRLIVPEIKARFKITLLLVSVTMVVAIAVGIPTGLLGSWFKNTLIDKFIHSLSMIAVAVPDFWLAFLLVILFSVILHWLPSFGTGSLKHFILPVICLGLANIARLNRLTRSGMLGVEREKYILAARAKGLSRLSAWFTHGFPNITVSIVTLIVTLFCVAITSTIIIESVFSWPGIGSYFVDAISYRDLPVIQAMVVLYGAVFIIGNTIADISYVIIDPRIRLE